MAVPDFQTMMMPFLEFLRDGNEHSYKEIAIALAEHYQLTDDDVNEMIPSKRQTKLVNRIYWISTYFRKSLVIEQPNRGYLRITERGRVLLNQKLPRIDMKTLEIYPEYVEFRDKKNDTQAAETITIIDSTESKTPDEILEDSYRTIRKNLASDLLAKVRACTPGSFEALVVELLVKMGYGGTQEDAGQAIGKSGDGGIDGIIKEDRLGLDVIYLQAKRWEATVGSPEIQKFAGALQGRRARKGVFITTSDYSRTARDFAANIENKIILIDGETLADLMIEHGVAVSVAATYEIKRIDSDYFIEE